MRYHLTPFRKAISKKPTKKNSEEDVKKRELSYTVDADVNWNNHFGELYGSSLSN